MHETRNTCEEFQRLLDRTLSGPLTPDESEFLDSHTRRCDACALLRQIDEHAARPSLDEIERRIPDEAIAQLWSRIARDLPPERSSQKHRPANRFRFTRLVPALVLATLLFLVLNAVLLVQVNRLTSREHELTQLLTRQTRILEETRFGRSRSPASRLTGGGTRFSQLHGLSWQQPISIRELRSILEQLPRDLQIVAGPYMDLFLSRLPSWERAKWRKILQRIDAADGIQPQEAIALLDALPLDPEDTITPARLATLDGF